MNTKKLLSLLLTAVLTMTSLPLAMATAVSAEEPATSNTVVEHFTDLNGWSKYEDNTWNGATTSGMYCDNGSAHLDVSNTAVETFMKSITPSNNDWTFEVRAKLITSGGECHIKLEQQTSRVRIMLRNNASGVGFANKGWLACDATTWHTYKIVASGSTADVYVDGQILVQGLQLETGKYNPSMAIYGKSANGTNAELLVDYIKYTAGEEVENEEVVPGYVAGETVEYNFGAADVFTGNGGTMTYNGYAHLTVEGQGVNGTYQTNIEAADNYVLEFRASVKNRGNNCHIMLVNNGYRVWFMPFGTTGFWFNASAPATAFKSTLDTYSWHTFKIVVTNKKDATIYYDGTQIGTQELGVYGGPSLIQIWGQGKTNQSSDMRIDYIKYTTLEEAPEEVVATEEKGLPSIGILMLLLAKKTQTEDAEPTDTIALRVPTRSKEAGFEYITVNTGVDLEPGATYKYSFDLWFTQDISDPACADPTTTYHYSTNKLRGVRTLIIGATLTNHNNVATWPFPEAMFRRELEAGKVMTVSSRFTVSEDQAAGTELALRIRKDNGEYSRGELMIDNIKIWKDGSEEYIVNETFAEGVLPEYITANAEGVELIDLGDGTSIPSEKPEDETPVEVSSVTYNFDTDEGWTKADGVTYDGNAHLKVTSTTILNVAKAVEAAENYTLEFRAKMTTRGNQCGIKLTQATHRLLFMFVPGQFLIAGGEMQMLDTSEMHTYKIVVTGSKNATVYVDGKEIAKQELQASAGGPAITMFAQGAADGTASEIYVDYIKYSVNE